MRKNSVYYMLASLYDSEIHTWQVIDGEKKKNATPD